MLIDLKELLNQIYFPLMHNCLTNYPDLLVAGKLACKKEKEKRSRVENMREETKIK